jgi:NAD-dependent SIR2 family protein deacetylase
VITQNVDDLHERAGSKNVAFAWRIIESVVQKTNTF